MTRGSTRIQYGASIYDHLPLLLFDRFAWLDRDSVLAALRQTFGPYRSDWRFGGAYLYWAQAPEGGGAGTVLYCGEAVDLLQRQEQHLVGPPDGGNKFAALTAFFNAQPQAVCGLALLVIPPDALPWFSPPDDKPFLENGAAKEAGEALEGLLLKASINLTGAMPLFNSRNDASKKHHVEDVFRYRSLARFLLDFRDVTQDFCTFWIRDEQRDAQSKLGDLLQRCQAMRRP